MAKFPLGTRRSGIRLGTTWRWAFWFTLTQPVRSVRVRRFQTPRRICGVQGRVRTGFPGARTGEPTCSTYLSETGVCSRKTRVGQRRVRVAVLNLGTTRPTKSLSVAIAPLNDVYKYTIERGYILSHIRRDYSPSQTCHNSPKPAHFVCGSGVGHVGCPFGYCH